MQFYESTNTTIKDEFDSFRVCFTVTSENGKSHKKVSVVQNPDQIYSAMFHFSSLDELAAFADNLKKFADKLQTEQVEKD